MQIPNLTLAYAVLESHKALENAVVRKVQELENNWLKIKLHSKQGQKELVIAPEVFFFSNYPMHAKQVSSGFGAFLRKHLENKKILGISQHGFDRIVVFEFADFFLILELFAKGNVALADKAMKILGVLRREQWKDRTLQKGAVYCFPSSKGKNPLEISLLEFEKFLQSDSEIVKELIKSLNIAPVFAEEALLESNIVKSLPAKTVSKKDLQKLLEKIKLLYAIKDSKLKPVLGKKDSGQFILPFAIKSAQTVQNFCSLNDAFEEFFAKGFLSKEQKSQATAFQKKLAELQKSLAMQLEAKARLEEKIELEKKKGEAIFSHYAEIKKALDALGEAKAFGGKEKDIMYKLSFLGFVKRIDLKKKRIALEIN